MNLSTLRSLALVVAATVAASIQAQGINIHRVPKEGDSITFDMKGSIELGSQSLSFDMTSLERVAKVEASGNFTIEQTEQGLKINDQQIPVTGKPQSTVYKPTGEVATILGSDIGGEAYRMNNLTVILDPGKPVAIGDTWSRTIKGDPQIGSIDFKADYKVLGEEQMDGIDAIKLKCNIKETAGQRPESSDGIAWISKADGSLVRLETKWTAAPIPGLPEPANATIVISRVKAAR